MNFKSMFYAMILAATLSCGPVTASSFKRIAKKSAIIASLLTSPLKSQEEKTAVPYNFDLPASHVYVHDTCSSRRKKDVLSTFRYDVSVEKDKILLEGAVPLQEFNPVLYALACKVQKEMGIEEPVLYYCKVNYENVGVYLAPAPGEFIIVNGKKIQTNVPIIVINPVYYTSYSIACELLAHELAHLEQFTPEGYTPCYNPYKDSFAIEQAAEARAAQHLSCSICLSECPGSELSRAAKGYFTWEDWKLYADAAREEGLLCKFHAVHPTMEDVSVQEVFDQKLF
jgi:hypothetical protein